VRFEQPHQFCGPFAGFRHLAGVSESQHLGQGLIERRSLSGGKSSRPCALNPGAGS
jgi:hypothetical protein